MADILRPNMGGIIGPHQPQVDVHFLNNFLATNAMPSLNNGWSARFQAGSALDIKSVKLNWNIVTAPGAFTLRIETDDGLGRPSGNLYDANAVLTGLTPTAGTQTYTFSVLPTASLVPGDEYHVVVLITTAGTTHTLLSHLGVGAYPTNVLTAADGTTRTNFAEVANANPVCSLVLEDDNEVAWGTYPFSTSTGTDFNLFGTQAAGYKIVAPAGVDIELRGIRPLISKSGTPAGDLLVRVYDNSATPVLLHTTTKDKDRLATNRMGLILLSSTQIVPAGSTRYLVMMSPSSANASNDFNFRYFSAFSPGLINKTVFTVVTATNVTAASPWSEITDAAGFGVFLDRVVGTAGGGGRPRGFRALG